MLDVLRLILGLIADQFRSRVSLEAEVLALRQQINVLQRLRPKRPTFSSRMRPFTVELNDLEVSRRAPFLAGCITNTSGSNLR
jgi:hypothetical protein